MFKLLSVLIAVFAASNCMASEWSKLVRTADHKHTLMVDIESIRFSPYGNTTDPAKSKWKVTANMKIVDGNTEAIFLTGIDVQDCVDKQSGPVISIFPDSTSKTYTWTKDGTKMYDIQGQFLCSYARETIRRKKHEDEKHRIML